VTVDVKLFATLRLAVGRGSVTIESEGPVTVGALLRSVGEALGEDLSPQLLNEDGSLQVGTMILVGGRNIHHINGLESLVSGGEVAIFPPAGGG
jgi:molybdopterin synthase sulfur carrier subunit